MSERIISESWAILKPDGTVYEYPFSSEVAARRTFDWWCHLTSEKYNEFRIARVKLVEIEEEPK